MIFVTVKKKIKDSFLILLPILIISSSIIGSRFLTSSVSVFMGEFEVATTEEIVESTEIVTEALKDPTDLQTIIEVAKIEQKDLKQSGKIVEKTYTINNANNRYKNVGVKNTTKSHSVSIENSLNTPCKLKIVDKAEPVVLIYHTHTTESYEILDRGWYSNDYPTRSNDNSKNMVRVGDELCKRLSEAGYKVIHDTNIYDASYSGSYARSRVTIEQYKEKYPSLQVIIDVHRDGIKSSNGVKTKPTAIINNKKAAQIMIIAGCQDGSVKSFPGWENNLNFAIQLQSMAEDLYPGLMRPVYFCPRRYNMDTSPCGVLLEIGSDSNTLSEAVYSGGLIGDALAKLLDKYQGV